MEHIVVPEKVEMNLLIDLDGVVCAYDFPYLTQKYFGVTIPNNGIYTYSIEDSLGVPSKDVIDMFDVEVHSPPNTIRWAKTALEGFIAADYDVGIFTSRLTWMTIAELRDWLDKYEIPYTSIITNSTLPSYAHAHVDDSPTKLMNVARAIEVKHSILYTNPWNVNCLNITGTLKRAKNWKEVKEIVYGR